MSISNSKLEIKPYTKKELAAIYGIGARSFSTWLNKLEGIVGRKEGKYYNVKQVRLIIDQLGLPGTIGE